jgi:hypothetical protein
VNAYFEWLQTLSIPMWIATADTIWSFPTILFLHAIGMGLTAGSMFVVDLRLVGAAAPLRVSAMRLMFQLFWWGFALNVITGSLLFAAHAAITGHEPIYYAKLAGIAVGVVLVFPIQAFVTGSASDDGIPRRVRQLAALSLATWVAVISCGRFIAYLQ